MLTHAPLPSWPGLFRALLRRPPADAELAAPWCREGDVAGWLSRSAWSLALIASWRKRQSLDQPDQPVTPVTVWIPDYFCNSSLVALRHTGARLVFYPVNGEMEPDMAACRELLGSAPPDLFLLVHYFGRPAPAVAARDFCARAGAWLIEDAAHVLRPVDGVGTYGDFVLYSPHKHLSIPDGAVLIVRDRGSGRLGTDKVASFGPPGGWSEQLGQLPQMLEVSTNRTRTRAIVWLVKRVLQKLGIGSASRAAIEYSELRASADIGPPRLCAPVQSGLSRRLLAGLVNELADVARSRERHQLLWDALFRDDTRAQASHISAAERPVGRAWTPYLAAYRADPATAETTFGHWQHQGLPATTWPDLPPEVSGNRARHLKAWDLRHTHLYLPVHQSLNSQKMLQQFRLQEPAREAHPRLELAWDRVSRQQWEDWIAQAGRSNLLQSWAYGTAKAESSGWHVRRGVFYIGGEAIALVQLLQKRIAGVINVVRINRGPLCLRQLQGWEERAMWRQLTLLGNVWKARALSVAPEIGLSGSSLAAIADLELRQFSPRAWESVWIDLGLEVDALRKRLDGKWRNMLAAAQKAGLSLEIGSEEAPFEWMMERHREQMVEKNFAGPPPELLLALRRNLGAGERLLVLRALAASEPVAGICLILHGTAATYLLGWNGPQGRSLKANQYLLWQAIVHLKELGLRWFDLGGISEEHAPGVSAFKLGLNGERYELVGEYWKW